MLVHYGTFLIFLRHIEKVRIEKEGGIAMKKYTALLMALICLFVLAGCDKNRLPISEHTVLLTATGMNWGEVSDQEDYLANTSYTVYYDGTVEYYEDYNLSGKKNEDEWDMSDEDLNELYEILNGKFLKYDEDRRSANDGEGWKIRSYDEDQTMIHEFTGYIYSNSTLKKIVKLIS
jgi:hypothetical protein